MFKFTFYLFNLPFIYLKGIYTERHRNEEGSSIYWLIPRLLKKPGLEKAEVQSPDLNPSPAHGGQGV